MGKTVRRAYKFLLRPTGRQVGRLAACLEDHRQLYNAALQERREAWRRAGVSVRYGDQSAQLKDIRRIDPDYARWSFSSQQATLRRLDKAMQAFFRRLQTGGKPGFPRFKGRGWWDTVEWPKDGDGCRWSCTGETGPTCDEVPAEPAPPVDAPVGVDLGIASFLTTSHGAQVANPRHLAASAGRLACAQRALARGKRGSARRRKVRARVAAMHRKVGRQRLDHAHKTARWLLTHHNMVAHEDLRIANMTRSASGSVETPGTNVAQKTGLNRSILDAGWGVFLRVLADKAESAGRLVIAVNPANTSRTCPHCGHCSAENRTTQADFTCVRCGYTGHADVVGATNILRAGLALQAATAG